MRAFLAVELDEAVRRELGSAGRELERGGLGLRAVAVDNLHVTLRFLGDIAPATAAALERAVAGRVGPLAPFAIELGGAGCFPDERRPRVLWAGVREPAALFGLAAAVADATATVPGATAAEDRPFRAHVTFGRFRGRPSPAALEPAIEPLRHRAWGRSMVDAVVLFESRLEPTGAVYRAVWRRSLEGRG
jgi:2'-5' RNA ligase